MKEKYEAPKLFTKIYSLLWKIPFLQNIRILFYFIDYFILLTIKKPQKNNSEKKKVLIVYNGALGDTIMYYNLFESYKKIYTEKFYEITLVCQKANAVLLDKKFDKIIKAEFTKASVNLLERRRIFKEIRKQYYDIIIDPVGAEVCSPNVFTTRAAVGEKKIGVIYNKDKLQLPSKIRNRIYSKIIEVEGILGKHRIQLYVEFIRKLGDSECIATHANLPVEKIEINFPESYFIVYPSASIDVKCWAIERYAEIVKKIYNKTKFTLLVCGTKHDRKNVDKMVAMLDKEIPVVDMIEKTNIKEFIECIRKAKFVITNDTSTYHISVATQTKTFILAGGYTYDSFVNYQYANLGYRDPIIINHQKDCYNCDGKCPYNQNVFPCIEEITSEYAWKIIEKNI